MADYDIITVGGGIGGSALAKGMAERGHKVLVVERETKFKDRVRGEWIAPWGVAEAKNLGIYDALMQAGANLTPFLAGRAGPAVMPVRDLVQQSALGMPCLTMYHPELQETVLAEAETAGADVRRGAKVRGVMPGPEPRMEVESEAGTETLSARLVVGADGRNSVIRKHGGFETAGEEAAQTLAGVLIENTCAPADVNQAIFNPFLCQIAFVFPQGNGRARAYAGWRKTAGIRLQGDGDFRKLIEISIQTGAPAEFYEGAKQGGPVATFEGYDSYASHPYKDGVALVGDAAQTSDPTWGQGLSITLRDVRLLRDALLSTDDWEAAGHQYASASNESFQHVKRVEDWMTLVFMTPGPEADAVRAGTLPRLAVDPGIMPDTLIVGPELAPADEAARVRFLGA